MKLKILPGVMINAALFALVIYILTIFRHAYNMPVGDDYDAILAYLNKFVVADTAEKIQLFFIQHNEHRILLTHLVSISDLAIFGSVNFIHLIWFGTIGWLLSITAFWYFSHKESITPLEFAPAAIILLTFAHHEMMTWAMTSIQQYYQVCFGILAIGFMVNGRIYLSFIFYAAAIFTSGGGMSLVPLVNLYYLSQKKWRALSISLIFTILILAIYFIFLPYSSPPSSKIIDSVLHPMLLIGYFVGFIGALGNVYEYGYTSLLFFGLTLLLLFAYRARFSQKQAPFFFWICIYILITALLTALNRSDQGIYTSGDSRYSEYSLLFLASVYLKYMVCARSEKLKRSILNITFLFSVGLFCFWYPRALFHMGDRLYWLSNNIKTHPNWEHAIEIKKESARLGVFNRE